MFLIQCFTTLYSQDTLYVFKNNVLLTKRATADIDSITFVDPIVSTVTDIDGNVYNTVKIGTQTWMVENLRTTHYRNGDAITNIADNTAWMNATEGAYSWWSNNIANKTPWGAYYNRFAIDDPRGLTPEGWHVPTQTEWEALIAFLSLGTNNAAAAQQLRATGLDYWTYSTNEPEGTNTTGFTALGNGIRSATDGTFKYMKATSFYWTSTRFPTLENNNYMIRINKVSIASQGDGVKNHGLIVRCIMD